MVVIYILYLTDTSKSFSNLNYKMEELVVLTKVVFFKMI